MLVELMTMSAISQSQRTDSSGLRDLLFDVTAVKKLTRRPCLTMHQRSIDKNGTLFCVRVNIQVYIAGIVCPTARICTIEITFLLFWAGISVLCMSIGIDFTRAAFGHFGKVLQIEKDYGPIWPFNVSVVSFFTAAIAIWTRIIVQGAYDYLLDKDYFADKLNVELRESSKTR
ncbi:hypothetical protein CRE_07015 [Caenorhabditis remanei]|uniref:Uncharacterized protein n=1 Tax=Caenorhabditis remanei TaxID=31234 RepID=E3NEG7_CAERE|nr:hypothetical protein CRE_07015 [Caenorhabditis remanei]